VSLQTTFDDLPPSPRSYDPEPVFVRGSDTSRLAALSLSRGRSYRDRMAILATLEAYGVCCDDRLQELNPSIHFNALRKRRGECAEPGVAWIEKVSKACTTRSNNKADGWQITDAGRQALAASRAEGRATA
jgi:hypothetical protein